MKKVALIILSLTVCTLLLQAENTTKSTKKQKSTSIEAWKEMGPDNVGGRTNTILIDKDNSLKLYAGSAGGDFGCQQVVVRMETCYKFSGFSHIFSCTNRRRHSIRRNG